MKDSFGRDIHYLRVSVTDKCNLRCNYCMPREQIRYSYDDGLNQEEILRVIQVMAELGIDTVRLTGGEPLLRKEVEGIVSGIGEISGIKSITMTTNGVLLGEKLKGLIEAGLTGVNISLDTVNKQQFQDITGFDEFETVKRNILLAEKTSLQVKVNCVLQRGVNESSIEGLAVLAEKNKIDVRFIEMMPIGEGCHIKGISNEEVLRSLYGKWQGLKLCNHRSSGPAEYYSVPGFKGKIGLISALYKSFCNECNRLRLTKDGRLKVCLAKSGGVDLKYMMRKGASDEELVLKIREAVLNKPKEHGFGLPNKHGFELSKDMAEAMYRIGG